jgi:hypothetical protein
MRVLDLFSCVGCHALGMERAGHQTVALCESNEWRRARLAQNFPGVPIHDDVRTFAPPAADACFGGPPCQHTSVAAAIHGYRTQELPFGGTCSAAGSTPAQNGLSWSSHPETRRGKPKSLTTFAALAATSPSLSSALMTLVRLIFAGDVTWLPAPACRDWRSPGLRSHRD